MNTEITLLKIDTLDFANSMDFSETPYSSKSETPKKYNRKGYLMYEEGGDLKLIFSEDAFLYIVANKLQIYVYQENISEAIKEERKESFELVKIEKEEAAQRLLEGFSSVCSLDSLEGNSRYGIVRDVKSFSYSIANELPLFKTKKKGEL